MRRATILTLALIVATGCAGVSRAYDAEPAAAMRASYGMVASETGRAADEPERMIIRSATVNLETEDPDAAVEAAIERAKAHGGWVQQSGKGYATVRIPDKGLEEFIEAVEDLGEITHKEIRGEDITTQYRDTSIRLENLERAHKRYQELLDKAQNVAETLAVEKELERVVTEIEVLKGRVQYLEKQAAFSTVTLRFKKATKPGPLGWPFVLLYRGVKWLFVWD